MKEKNIILLEEMGCRINKEERADYIDLTNHRYYIRGLYIDKKAVLFEITKGSKMRFEKSNGVKLKKPVMEHDNKIWFHSYWRDQNGMCYGLINIDKELNKIDTLYTKADLIRAFNTITKYKIEDLIIHHSIFTDIKNLAGYRESEILTNCKRITEVMKTEEHHCIKFYDLEDNYFVYDIIQNKIVG